MADPKGTVNQHIIDTLLGRRANLVNEQTILKKAEKRLTDIDAEVGVINEELTARGHVDPPAPQE